jgi:hypothetical protein
MTTNFETPTPQKPTRRVNPAIFGGILLIVAGALALVSNWIDIGNTFVLFIGLAMLVLGCVTHNAGWIIPGGIVSGVGLGVFISEMPFMADSQFSVDGGSVFLISMAVGFGLVSLCARLFTAQKHDWALIPAGILAFIGALIALDSPLLQTLEFTRYIVPAGLVLVGIILIFSVTKKQQ